MRGTSNVYKYYLVPSERKKPGLWGDILRREPAIVPNVKFEHSKLLSVYLKAKIEKKQEFEQNTDLRILPKNTNEGI